MTDDSTTITSTAHQESGRAQAAQTLQRIRWLCEQVSGQDVLAVGGMAETVCRILAREGFRCAGIDVDPRVVDGARQSLATEIDAVRQRIVFHVQDAATLPFEESSFDTVVMDGVLQRLTHSRRTLCEARRVLRDGGRVIITVPCGPPPASEVDRTYYPSVLLEELQPLFLTRAADLQDDYLRYTGEKDAEQRVNDPARDPDAEDYRRLLKAIESRCLQKEQALVALEMRLATHTRDREEQAELLVRRLEELETRIAVTDQQNVRLENELKTAFHESESLQQRLQEECQANAGLREQLVNASAAVSDAELRLRGLQEESDRLQQELSATCAASQQRTEQAEALHGARLREREKHFRELLAGREAEWSRRVANQRIRELVRVCLPAEARVLVISHGDEDLVQLEGRHGAHFPQAVGGGYAGHHPRDAAEAIGHLESLKAKGAEYLLIPESSLWWLEFYGDFRAYLRSHGSLVVYQEDVCVIYALHPSPPERQHVCGLVLQAGELSAPSSAVADAAAWTADASEVDPTTAVAQPSDDHATMAVILDEFTADCLRPDCRLLPVRPDNWRKVVHGRHLDAVFVESAWLGIDGAWSNRLSNRDPALRDALTEIVEWAREQEIPSIFWNKEDPVHFERFLEAARLFSHVFTTDADCIPHYRERLGHDRVFALPFAAQPALHNPIQSQPRDRTVCFAGTYYGGRHRERQADMEHLLRPAIPFGLDIYDRKHGSAENGNNDYRFPDIYQPSIRGSLPYDEMVKAYKRYRVFLNVNCVNHSPTMFSRRVFELLACGTPVISTYSPGIIELLGEDVVFISETEADTRRHLESLLGDDDRWARAAVRGVRRVMREHTYQDRLRSVLERVGIPLRLSSKPRVAVILSVKTSAALDGVASFLSAKTFRHCHVVLISEQPLSGSVLAPLRNRLTDTSLVPLVGPGNDVFRHCLDATSADYLAFVNSTDWYGANYLLDHTLALSYSKADCTGKHTFYESDSDGVESLRRPGQEFAYVTSVPSATLVARREVMSESRFYQALSGELFPAGELRLLSIDRFNYLKYGLGKNTLTVVNSTATRVMQGPLSV